MRRDTTARDLTLAWNTAAFVRLAHDGKLPALEKVLSHLGTHGQNATEQRVMLGLLSERYGIPLKERTH